MSAIGACAGVWARATARPTAARGGKPVAMGGARVAVPAGVGSRVRAVRALKAAPIGAARDGSSARRGLRVVARVASSTPPDGGDTRVATSVGGIVESLRDRVQRNFRMLPIALICLLVGFSMCALFPHPESPGDATICFTIIFLSEFVSSVLYAAKRPRGMLKWLRKGKLFPLMLNAFKIGVLYGLFCDAFKVGS
jgi:hypothetical protein